MSFHQTTLTNGLDIVAECQPHALSAAVGFFVRAGARDEGPEAAGVSHFLEHMAFKGTEDRSADDMNRLFDEIGAKYNAYTTEEHTVYHAAVLPEYLPQTIDLLGDLLRPTLRADDFEMEKKVILEEIGMYADSPMWTAYERCMRLHFADHPLGNSVLGTTDSVGGLTREAMSDYHATRYSPSNIIIAASGNLDWERLTQLVQEKCGDWELSPASRRVEKFHQVGESELLVSDKFIQENLLIMAEAPAADSHLRFAAELLANIIGDDTGSRFYWALSEPGKVETIDCSYHEYEDAGAMMVSAGCDPELTAENLDTIRQILTEVMRSGVTATELQQAKNKLGSRVVLAAERPKNRLFSVAYNWSFRKDYRSVSDDLDELHAVTLEDIATVCKQFPLDQHVVVCLGPLESLSNLRAG